MHRGPSVLLPSEVLQRIPWFFYAVKALVAGQVEPCRKAALGLLRAMPSPTVLSAVWTGTPHSRLGNAGKWKKVAEGGEGRPLLLPSVQV